MAAIDRADTIRPMCAPDRPGLPPSRLLLGPGPSPVDRRVYEALARPVVGHLDPYMFDMLTQVQALLRRVFGTQNPCTIVVSGTGTAGMEAALTALVERGSKVAVFVNGFFCERIAEAAVRLGGEVARTDKAWGEAFGDDEARDFILRERPEVVAYVHGETSTGVLQPGRAICEAAQAVGALVVGDCVTSLGNLPVDVDETGIDIAFSCSQKGLACVPGLSPITVSPRALDHLRNRRTPIPSFYLDLSLLLEYWTERRYHHTASSSLFSALREALALIEEEGLDNRFRRVERNHRAFVAGIEAMGLQMHVAPEHRLWPLNAVRVPEGISDEAVRARLLNDAGIEILGGFGRLAGRIFRIGIMGAGSTRENVLRVLAALQAALGQEGYRPVANGVAAAEACYERL
jgi:alanine-glyoxylate transaminase/serine-glyoxylate transaminase/serine-pyruvate transaminase